MLDDCEWEWDDSLKCTTSCGGGVRMRIRKSITNNEQLECSGSVIEHEQCNAKPCPELETLQNFVKDVEQLKSSGIYEFNYAIVF